MVYTSILRNKNTIARFTSECVVRFGGWFLNHPSETRAHHIARRDFIQLLNISDFLSATLVPEIAVVRK